jgi:tRNA G18 (ribose-2'-O)-methylase SpoU
VRGYFGIGVEGISKPMNLGNLMRSAHAFGASFFFTVDADRRVLAPRSDTSRCVEHLPLHHWSCVAGMGLPEGCELVGIELLPEAVELPSFRHPSRAAYVLGPERGSLSPEMLARCRHVIRIPTGFCINVATAGAIVMYDRIRSRGRFAARPVRAGGPEAPAPGHVFGAPRRRGAEDDPS